MDELRLEKPAPALLEQAMEYKQEHLRCGEAELHGGALLDRMEFSAWLRLVEENGSPETVHDGWVRADTFFAVRKADGRIVGMVDIRHTLNDFLAAYGGHIGYGVRPSERRKGYAGEILRLALAHAKQAIGLKRVMIACYRDNEASRKTILRNGGRLEREFVHTDGQTVQVYWVDLS